MSSLWKCIEVLFITLFCFLSSSTFWGLLLTVATDLLDLLISLVVGAEPTLKFFEIWAFLFVLGCSAELLILAGWLLIRLFKSDSQLYHDPVLMFHAAAIRKLCMALYKWCDLEYAKPLPI